MLYIVISISISLKQVKFLVQNFLVKNWMIEGKEQFLGRDILARIIVVNIEIQWFPGKKKIIADLNLILKVQHNSVASVLYLTSSARWSSHCLR